MKEFILTAFAIFYILMAIFSYGHSANRCIPFPENEQQITVLACMNTLTFSVFWPFYISYAMQQND